MHTADLSNTELQQISEASKDALLRAGNNKPLSRLLKRVIMQATVELMTRSMRLTGRK